MNTNIQTSAAFDDWICRGSRAALDQIRQRFFRDVAEATREPAHTDAGIAEMIEQQRIAQAARDAHLRYVEAANSHDFLVDPAQVCTEIADWLEAVLLGRLAAQAMARFDGLPTH